MPDLVADDKWDKFAEERKSTIALGVQKDHCMTFEDAAPVAPRVEEAFNDSRCTAFEPMGNVPIPMEIGNVKAKWRHEKKKLTDEKYDLVKGKGMFHLQK